MSSIHWRTVVVARGDVNAGTPISTPPGQRMRIGLCSRTSSFRERLLDAMVEVEGEQAANREAERLDRMSPEQVMELAQQ